MGSGGDDVGVGEGVCHHLSCHKARGVGHVCHEVRSHIVCSLAHAPIVVVSGICRCSCKDTMETFVQVTLGSIATTAGLDCSEAPLEVLGRPWAVFWACIVFSRLVTHMQRLQSLGRSC